VSPEESVAVGEEDVDIEVLGDPEIVCEVIAAQRVSRHVPLHPLLERADPLLFRRGDEDDGLTPQFVAI
jgi:hypothetical protein